LLRSSSDTFHSGFPTELICISYRSQTCYMTCLSNPPWFGYSNSILWRVQIMKLLIVYFSSASCYFVSLRTKYSQHLVLRHPQSLFFRLCGRQSFTQTKTYVTFHSMLFYVEKSLPPCPISKLEEHPMSVWNCCLIYL
jgi:hypothetical protein